MIPTTIQSKVINGLSKYLGKHISKLEKKHGLSKGYAIRTVNGTVEVCNYYEIDGAPVVITTVYNRVTEIGPTY
jgi:hypothetical protein